MPKRRADSTEDAAPTETGGTTPEPRPEEATLPVPGAESERVEPAAEPETVTAETVTVDAAPEPPAELEPFRLAETPADVREDVEEHHEEEGMSLAARLLSVLLLLLAGAAIGVWGAPRLAPLLPSGMQPVADWLAPGQKAAESELAEIRARVDEGLGGVESRFADFARTSEIDTRIGAAVASAETRLKAEVTALQDRVNADDGAEARQRLARAESTLQGQAAELAALKEQLSGAAAATGQMNEDAVAKIDVYRGEVDGLRAEMGTLQDKVAALAVRIDEVAAQADRQIETAQTRVGEIETQASTALTQAETGAELALIRAAIASGQPYQESIDKLAGRLGAPVPEGLAAAASGGVETMAQLRDSYPDAAHAAIRASILAGAGEGVWARSRAYLAAQVASRSLTPQAGMGTDAVLSRMEERLRHDDLPGVLDESDQLPTEAAAAMSGWLDAARRRAEATAALAGLGAAAPAGN